MVAEEVMDSEVKKKDKRVKTKDHTAGTKKIRLRRGKNTLNY